MAFRLRDQVGHVGDHIVQLASVTSKAKVSQRHTTSLVGFLRSIHPCYPVRRINQPLPIQFEIDMLPLTSQPGGDHRDKFGDARSIHVNAQVMQLTVWPHSPHKHDLFLGVQRWAWGEALRRNQQSTEVEW